MAELSRAEAEEFLFEEARLLDERRFDEWLRLFTPAGIYWLPIREDADASAATSLVYDEPMRREERVHRLLHTPAQAQTPPSRTLHMIANVSVQAGAETGADTGALRAAASVRVHSNQVVHQLRRAGYTQTIRGEPGTHAGRCEHQLVDVDGRWRIALKKVVLLDRDVPIANLTFIF